jgi:hypothetical protein
MSDQLLSAARRHRDFNIRLPASWAPRLLSHDIEMVEEQYRYWLGLELVWLDAVGVDLQCIGDPLEDAPDRCLTYVGDGPYMSETAEQIVEIRKCHDGLKSLPIDADTARDRLWDRLGRLQRAVAATFGASRGWREGKPFPFDLLIPVGQYTGKPITVTTAWLDHRAYYYCLADRSPAAIAAHNYCDPEKYRREYEPEAARLGLRLEVTPFVSWYYPGRSQLMLWIRPAGFQQE